MWSNVYKDLFLIILYAYILYIRLGSCVWVSPMIFLRILIEYPPSLYRVFGEHLWLVSSVA
jgi:hypothetical protein